jgi:hypothetical protein
VRRVSEPLWDDSGVNRDKSGVIAVAHARPTRWMRVLRGSVGATFATLTAAFSHVVAGGSLPSPAAIALTLALSLLLWIALSGRTHSLWRTTAAVGLSQALFHGIFSKVAASGTVVLSPHSGHHGAHEAVTILGAAADHAAHPSWMWLAHTAAALLTIAALRHGEAALRALGLAAALLFAPLTRTTVPLTESFPRRIHRVGCARTIVPRDLSMLFSALRHRGPPQLATA